jgi:hypothetical protein
MSRLWIWVVSVAVAIASIPCTIAGIFFGYNKLEQLRSYYEVPRYIQRHQEFVAECRADPHVHLFSITRDKEHPWTALIEFDVDDRMTYLKIESAIRDWGLMQRPYFKTKLRSNEDLGNDWGVAAEGMGEAGRALYLFVFATFVSITTAPIFGGTTAVILTLWKKRRRKSGERNVARR